MLDLSLRKFLHCFEWKPQAKSCSFMMWPKHAITVITCFWLPSAGFSHLSALLGAPDWGKAQTGARRLDSGCSWWLMMVDGLVDSPRCRRSFWQRRTLGIWPGHRTGSCEKSMEPWKAAWKACQGKLAKAVLKCWNHNIKVEQLQCKWVFWKYLYELLNPLILFLYNLIYIYDQMCKSFIPQDNAHCTTASRWRSPWSLTTPCESPPRRRKKRPRPAPRPRRTQRFVAPRWGDGEIPWNSQGLGLEGTWKIWKAAWEVAGIKYDSWFDSWFDESWWKFSGVQFGFKMFSIERSAHSAYSNSVDLSMMCVSCACFCELFIKASSYGGAVSCMFCL